jgi:hypothetical protein
MFLTLLTFFRTIFEKAEPYLVLLQEWALWTDPTSSAMALAGFHVIFWFLTFWCTSAIYTAAWLGLIGAYIIGEVLNTGRSTFDALGRMRRMFCADF